MEMDFEKVWSVNDLVENRNNWNLSADSELLKHIQHLSKNIIGRTRSTLELLESFESDVDQTCLSVANIGNRFKSLSDTQFIENKIQESPEAESMIYEETKESQNREVENVSAKLKEALDNGLTVLNSHYDIITVSDSDSENEEPQEILLKSCNPFIKRRLPYIIGTNDFTKFDHLGLADSSSDEEEEDELANEEIEKEQPYDREDVLSRKNFTNIASTQIIQISSSDSDDSILSAKINSRRVSTKDNPTTENNSLERNLAQSLPKTGSCFADHLNAALLEAGEKRPAPVVNCTRNDSFSPPPFPVKSNSNFSSDEEKSDSGNSVSSTSRSSPCFFTSPSHTVGSNDYNIKSNDGITDEMHPNESSISKSVEYDDKARNSNTLFTVGPNSGPSSDVISHHHEEKKLSRALANEFKSMILAKNNSVLSNRSSIGCNSEEPVLSSIADENVEKLSTTTAPFHFPRKDDKRGIDIDGSGKEIDRNVLSSEDQSTLVSSVAAESSKSSWRCDNADDDGDDDDDDDDDDWFNRAVSSRTPRNVGSVTADASKSSKLPPLKNFNESSAKETVNHVLITDSKTITDSTSSIKEKPVGVLPQTKKTAIEAEVVKTKPSLFGSEDDTDDDDLFTKKPIIASDKHKTNELYDILFNDSDIDDPILALVEENKRRVDVNKSVGSTRFDDSEIRNKPTKNSDISSKNYSSSLIDDYESNVIDETKGKLSASRVTVTDENILSEKIIPKAEAKEIFADDFLVSDIHIRKDETSKMFHIDVQIPEFYDTNFEDISNENAESGSSEGVLKSNSSAVKKNALDLSAKIAESWKPGLDFLQSNPDEPTIKTAEKKKDQFENLSSSPANSLTCKENDENQQQSCSLKNTNSLLERSVSTFGSKNGATKISSSMKNQVLPDSAPISDFGNQQNHQSPSSSLSQTSSNFYSDEFSPNASSRLEIAASSFSENSSAPSEIIIHAHNITNLDGENSCEQNSVKEETQSCLKTTKPGKLAAGRGASVNINALLPTSMWSKPNLKTVKTGEMMSDDKENDNADSISTPVHSNLLSVTKNRTKIPSKRRPPTRRGRVAHLSVQSSPAEIVVANDSEPFSKDLNESVHGTNSVTFCEPSADKSTHVTQSDVNSAIDVVPISVVAEDTSKNTSRVGTSNSEFKDVNSIFDSIFCDDSGKDVISNSTSAVVSPVNTCDLSSKRDLVAQSNLPLTNPSSQQNKLGKTNLFSDDSENDFTSSSINDYEKIESSDLWKIADSPQKSNLPSHVAGNNENLKSAQNSQKTSTVFKKDKEQVDSFSCSTKKEAVGSSVSKVKSDLFGDDDDEDFNKLFSSSKKPRKNLPNKNSSLFADDDEDDENLFGVKTPRPNRKETS